jgi:multidrug resistance efflux pump
MSLKPQQTIVTSTPSASSATGEILTPSAPSDAVASQAETAPAEQEEPAKARRGGGARKIALIILTILGGLLAWYVASDRLAPYSAVGSGNAAITQVAPRVAGEVVEVAAADNQYVEKGDVLFALDPRPFDIAVRQAEANYDQVVQTVGASNLSLSAQQAKVDQAQAALDFARTVTERNRQLLDRGLMTQVQADKSESDLLAAQSALQVAESDYESAIVKAGGTAASNPQVAAAAATLEQARLNREFATVTAPAAGVITNLRLATGQFINVGTPALTFIASERPWVMADLREGQLINVEPGDKVSIAFDARPGMVFVGHVQGVAWGIDPGRTIANGLPQNQSSSRWFEPARTIPVHIELDDSSEWPANVRVGSKVSVVIYSAGDNNPIAWIANGLLHVQSFFSYLY